MVRHTRLAVVTAAAALLAASAARAADTYDLKPRLAPDQQWAIDQTTTTSMSGTYGGQQFQQSGTQKRSSTVTVLAVRDASTPSAIRVAFGPDCGSTGAMNGQDQSKPFPLAGKTVRVKKDDLGIVEIDGADADQPTTTELANMLTPDRTIIPKAPVSVGDTWDGDSAAMIKQMGWGPGDTAGVKCRLTRIGSAAGRPTADVAVELTGTQTQNGVATKLAMTGTVQIDLATGQPLVSDLTGTLNATGQANGPQGAMAVQGDGKLDIHVTARPVAGIPAAGAGGAPTTPAATAGGNPLATDGGGGAVNPLAAPSVDRFAGTYKNDRMSVHFDPPADGTYSGTITLNGHQFGATARADGAKLAGKFQSNGNSFDFTATVDGSTLQLTSGQSEYTLTKPAAENPLDAGGAASNPLGR